MTDFYSQSTDVKIFIEELTLLPNDWQRDTKLTYSRTTGKIKELKGWSSLSVSNSLGVDSKNITLSFANANDMMIYALPEMQHPAWGYGFSPRKAEDYISPSDRWVDDILNKYGREPYLVIRNPYIKNKSFKDIKDILKQKNWYGITDQQMAEIENDGDIFLLDYGQRIWIVTRTFDLRLNEYRYNVAHGIIHTFSYTSSVDSYSLNIKMTGLTSLMKNFPIFLQKPVAIFERTVYKEMLPVLEPLWDRARGLEDMFSQMNPMTAFLLPFYLVNLFMSIGGFYNDYVITESDLQMYRDKFLLRFFPYINPLWHIDGLYSIKSAVPLQDWANGALSEKDLQGIQGIIDKNLDILFKEPETCMLEQDGELYQEYLKNREFTIDKIFDEGYLPSVQEMEPRIVYDPLIKELDDNFYYFKKSVRNSFQLYNVAHKTGAAILEELSSKSYTFIYEEDAGDIYWQLPKFWELPHEKNATVWVDKEYEKLWEDSEARGKIKKLYNSEDYLISSLEKISENVTTSMDNIVTFAEISAEVNYIGNAGNDIVNKQALYGYAQLTDNTAINEDDFSRYLRFLQARFGLRIAQLNPIAINSFMYRLDNGVSVAINQILNIFARSALIWRNFSSQVKTLATTFKNWLILGRNVVDVERLDIGLLHSKNWSYDIEGGNMEASMELAFVHKPFEFIPNPFFEAQIWAKKHYDEQKAKAQTHDELMASNLQQYDDLPKKIAPAHYPKTAQKTIETMKKIPYIDIFKKAAEKYNVPTPLLFSIAWKESHFNPKAKSKVGAMGIMQIMPNTWNAYKPYSNADPYNVEDNIMAAAKYLGWIHKLTGNIKLTLAAYNVGIGYVAYAVYLVKNNEPIMKGGVVLRYSQDKNKPHVDKLIRDMKYTVAEMTPEQIAMIILWLPLESRDYVSKISRKYMEYTNREIAELDNMDRWSYFVQKCIKQEELVC